MRTIILCLALISSFAAAQTTPQQPRPTKILTPEQIAFQQAVKTHNARSPPSVPTPTPPTPPKSPAKKPRVPKCRHNLRHQHVSLPRGRDHRGQLQSLHHSFSRNTRLAAANHSRRIIPSWAPAAPKPRPKPTPPPSTPPKPPGAPTPPPNAKPSTPTGAVAPSSPPWLANAISA